MYNIFKEQAVEIMKKASREDNKGNYKEAYSLYMKGIEYFTSHLKYENNPKIREAIIQKFTGYLRRAEEIRRNCCQCDCEGLPKLPAAIVKEKPNVKWSDVAGLESAKRDLHEAVILPLRFPQLFTGKRRPWRTFLLHGPSGTGKTYLAKAVAAEANYTFFSVSASDLVSKWMGESEKLVSNIFQMAHESSPSIIFIDEVDSLCNSCGEDNRTEASMHIKTELLLQMQAMEHNDEKVLVLAATNAPYTLDQAICRRFDKRIYVPLPDVKAREQIFKVQLGDTPHNLNEDDFEYLGRRTERFSCSDISICVKDVLNEPIRKTQEAMFFSKTPEGMWTPCGAMHPNAISTTMLDLAAKGLSAKIVPPPIMRIDFEKVLVRQKATVSRFDIELHERFTKDFGEGKDKEKGVMWTPCVPLHPNASPSSIHHLSTKDLPTKTILSPIRRIDFTNVINQSTIQVHERFAKEFREGEKIKMNKHWFSRLFFLCNRF